jgi:hypothetical protein
MKNSWRTLLLLYKNNFFLSINKKNIKKNIYKKFPLFFCPCFFL